MTQWTSAVALEGLIAAACGMHAVDNATRTSADASLRRLRQDAANLGDCLVDVLQGAIHALHGSPEGPRAQLAVTACLMLEGLVQEAWLQCGLISDRPMVRQRLLRLATHAIVDGRVAASLGRTLAAICRVELGVAFAETDDASRGAMGGEWFHIIDGIMSQLTLPTAATPAGAALPLSPVAEQFALQLSTVGAEGGGAVGGLWSFFMQRYVATWALRSPAEGSFALQRFTTTLGEGGDQASAFLCPDDVARTTVRFELLLNLLHADGVTATPFHRPDVIAAVDAAASHLTSYATVEAVARSLVSQGWRGAPEGLDTHDAARGLRQRAGYLNRMACNVGRLMRLAWKVRGGLPAINDGCLALRRDPSRVVGSLSAAFSFLHDALCPSTVTEAARRDPRESPLHACASVLASALASSVCSAVLDHLRAVAEAEELHEVNCFASLPLPVVFNVLLRAASPGVIMSPQPPAPSAADPWQVPPSPDSYALWWHHIAIDVQRSGLPSHDDGTEAVLSGRSRPSEDLVAAWGDAAGEPPRWEASDDVGMLVGSELWTAACDNDAEAFGAAVLTQLQEREQTVELEGFDGSAIRQSVTLLWMVLNSFSDTDGGGAEADAEEEETEEASRQPHASTAAAAVGSTGASENAAMRYFAAAWMDRFAAAFGAADGRLGAPPLGAVFRQSPTAACAVFVQLCDVFVAMAALGEHWCLYDRLAGAPELREQLVRCLVEACRCLFIVSPSADHRRSPAGDPREAAEEGLRTLWLYSAHGALLSVAVHRSTNGWVSNGVFETLAATTNYGGAAAVEPTNAVAWDRESSSAWDVIRTAITATSVSRLVAARRTGETSSSGDLGLPGWSDHVLHTPFVPWLFARLAPVVIETSTAPIGGRRGTVAGYRRLGVFACGQLVRRFILDVMPPAVGVLSSGPSVGEGPRAALAALVPSVTALARLSTDPSAAVLLIDLMRAAIAWALQSAPTGSGTTSCAAESATVDDPAAARLVDSLLLSVLAACHDSQSSHQEAAADGGSTMPFAAARRALAEGVSAIAKAIALDENESGGGASPPLAVAMVLVRLAAPLAQQLSAGVCGCSLMEDGTIRAMAAGAAQLCACLPDESVDLASVHAPLMAALGAVVADVAKQCAAAAPVTAGARQGGGHAATRSLTANLLGIHLAVIGARYLSHRGPRYGLARSMPVDVLSGPATSIACAYARSYDGALASPSDSAAVTSLVTLTALLMQSAVSLSQATRQHAARLAPMLHPIAMLLSHGAVAAGVVEAVITLGTVRVGSVFRELMHLWIEAFAGGSRDMQAHSCVAWLAVVLVLRGRNVSCSLPRSPVAADATPSQGVECHVAMTRALRQLLDSSAQTSSSIAFGMGAHRPAAMTTIVELTTASHPQCRRCVRLPPFQPLPDVSWAYPTYGLIVNGASGRPLAGVFDVAPVVMNILAALGGE